MPPLRKPIRVKRLTIEQWLRGIGKIKGPLPKGRVDPIAMRFLLTKTNLNEVEIARVFGVSHVAVIKWRKKINPERPKYGESIGALRAKYKHSNTRNVERYIIDELIGRTGVAIDSISPARVFFDLKDNISGLKKGDVFGAMARLRKKGILKNVSKKERSRVCRLSWERKYPEAVARRAEMFAMFKVGLRDIEIARKLGISDRTVWFYRQRYIKGNKKSH